MKSNCFMLMAKNENSVGVVKSNVIIFQEIYLIDALSNIIIDVFDFKKNEIFKPQVKNKFLI